MKTEKEYKTMPKSVYSLVLTDEIIEKIDRLAYTRNTNRSNMINQILAEYVSYVTPEKRMRDVFDRLETMLTGDEGFQLMMKPSESMMNLRSAISYKYNPTVRYSVELYREEGGDLGLLKVQLRTQNRDLIYLMNRFCSLWTALERRSVGPTECESADGRFFRKLTLRTRGNAPVSSLSAEEAGELIANYVSAFDSALKAYFYELNDPERASASVASVYAAYLRRAGERFL